jgi:sulfatase modifying factor 1
MSNKWLAIPILSTALCIASNITSNASTTSYSIKYSPTPKDMVRVNGGKLINAAHDKKTDIQDLYVGTSEVTNEQWDSVIGWRISQGVWMTFTVLPSSAGLHQYNTTGNYFKLPVRNVNFEQAIAWCNLLSLKEGLTPVYYKMKMKSDGTFPPIKGNYWGYIDANESNPYSDFPLGPYMDETANGYRLPLSSEWEWVAFGGRSKSYFTYGVGNDLAQIANTDPFPSLNDYIIHTLKRPIQVKSKLPSELGIYDLIGNVSEWCFDAQNFDELKQWPGWNGPSYRDDIFGKYGNMHTQQRVTKGQGYLYSQPETLNPSYNSFGYTGLSELAPPNSENVKLLYGFRLFRNADAPTFTLSVPQRQNIPLRAKNFTTFPGKIVHVGYNFGNGPHTPNNEISLINDFVWAEAEPNYAAALRSNGKLVTWSSTGQAPVAYEYAIPNIAAIATGSNYVIVALKDGSIKLLASPLNGLNIPVGGQIPTQFNLPDANREIIDIETGDNYTIFLLADGTIDGWGNPVSEIKSNNQGNNIVELTGSKNNIGMLRKDGQVLVFSTYVTPDGLIVVSNKPQNLTNVVAIDSGDRHMIALRENGTVVCWGTQDFQVTAPTYQQFKAVAVDAGAQGSISVLFEDGTIVSSHNNFSMVHGKASYTTSDRFYGLKIVPEPQLVEDITNMVSIEKVASNNEGYETGREFGYNEGFEAGREQGYDQGIEFVLNDPSNFSLIAETEITPIEGAALERGIGMGRLEILSNPTAFGLYTEQSIQNLKMGGLILKKGAGNQVNLNLKLKQSSDLINWTTADQIQWNLPLSGNKTFLRVTPE